MMRSEFFSTNFEAIKLIFKNEKWLIPSIVLDSLFNNLSPYINIYMSALIVNEIAGLRDVTKLIKLVLFTISANLLIIIFRALFGKLKKIRFELFKNAEQRMFMNYGFTLDYEHLENSKVQNARRKIDESKRINNFGIWAMVYSFEYFLDNVINLILSLIFMSSLIKIIITRYNNLIGIRIFLIIIIVFVSLSVIISIKNSKKLSKLGEDLSENMLYVNKISNSYGGYQMGKDIRIYNMINIYRKLNDEVEKVHIKGSEKYWYGHRNTQLPDQLISQVINFSIYAFVCLNALRGFFEIGSVIMYVSYINRVISACKDISSNIAMLKMNLPFLQHYLNFFKIENKMDRGMKPIEKSCEKEYELEFRDVSFKYPGTNSYVLKNLNFKIDNRKRLAVVGMNGSGKTTMIKLLCRLYEPTEGMILLNGTDIQDYDYAEYMNLFSVVFQDFKLFSVGLGQNVATNMNFDKTKVDESLKKAGFDQRLINMPKGLDTCLYKDFEVDGVEISGGEAQKIAIARAIYKNAPFIILDEPTSALDPISEYEIYSKFNEIVGDKTAIYISHRLSSCRFCDEIIVFHEGILIQHGTHDELMKNKHGKYYELWNAQAQYYK